MAAIQFIKGVDEESIPDVRLTRSRDGSTGTATFRFINPKVLEADTMSQGEITGMYLKDEEGELTTREVNAKFINGKPQAIEAIYVMKSPESWDRFMRFMERYAQNNGLSFTKAE
uniref:Photosystem II reaction center Psb28 protein n=1 Tax=Gronococcus sybilensis TaxID=3028029 RepID=A0A9Y1I2E9_9RHOD|nr:photosystem II protein W [Gronococcus sybilensis]